MKFFRYAIYGLTIAILISLVVLIIQPEQSAVFRPEQAKDAHTGTGKSVSSPNMIKATESKSGSMTWKSPPVQEAIQEIIQKTDITNLPPFIQALPLDPAEIDRNGNSIRDDLEVYIGYRFPFEPKNRATLIQLVTILDRIAKDGGKTKMSRQMAFYLEEQMAEACWYKNGFDENDFSTLKSMVLNNKHRKKGYNNAMEVRNSVPPEELDDIIVPENPCDQMQVENQMFLQNWKPEN